MLTLDDAVQLAFYFFALGLFLLTVGDFFLGTIEWLRRFLGR